MFVHNLKECQLLIYCKQKPDESILISVSKNNTSNKNMLDTSGKYFCKIPLPEIISRKLDYTNDNDRKRYCFCKRTSFGNIIACQNLACPYEWLHYCRFGITRAPEGRCTTKSSRRFFNSFKLNFVIM